MSEEIEVKWLVKENGINFATDNLSLIYLSLSDLERDILDNGIFIKQGYLPIDLGLILARELEMNCDFLLNEARLRNKGGKFYFTLKGKGGLSRQELETEIKKDTFEHYWEATISKRIEKKRMEKHYLGFTTEIDVYTNRDLIVGEIEVPSAEIAHSLIPFGKDITKDLIYKNVNLAR